MKLKDIVLKKGDMIYHDDGYINIVNSYNANNPVKNIENELTIKQITKIERPIKYETIYEAPKEILTKEEKEYLEYMIRPFREYTTTINKTTGFYDQYIIIDLTYNNNSIRIPIIQSNMKFEGMELYKKYSLKELGLFEGE